MALRGHANDLASNDGAQDFAVAEEKLALAEKKLMQGVAKGILHKNAASRKVSRLTVKLNKAKAE